jgi:hypothetical protein
VTSRASPTLGALSSGFFVLVLAVGASVAFLDVLGSKLADGACFVGATLPDLVEFAIGTLGA